MIRTANRLHTVEEYYFSKKLREVRGLIAEGRPIINMGIGSPDLSPPKEVIESIPSPAQGNCRFLCFKIQSGCRC